MYHLQPHPNFFFSLCIFLFIWLHWVLVVVYGIFTLPCGMRNLLLWQNLVSWPGIEPGIPSLGTWGLNHWTTREVPCIHTFNSCSATHLNHRTGLSLLFCHNRIKTPSLRLRPRMPSWLPPMPLPSAGSMHWSSRVWHTSRSLYLFMSKAFGIM